MILEYTCENFKSIKNKVTFSMLASKDNTFEDHLISFNGLRINKTASIYGANGSGKSSFIESLDFLKFLITKSNNHQPGDSIMQRPHKLSDSRTPTSYTIQFVKDDIRYAYGLSYTSKSVLSEYLYYFPNGKQAKIFERSNDTLSFGDKFKKALNTVISFSKPNKLFLSVAANYSAVKETEEAFIFFKENIINYPVAQNNWLDYSVEQLSNNEQLKSIFIKFMNIIGTPIKNIYTKFQKMPLTPDLLPSNVPNQLKELLIQTNEAHMMEAKLDYGSFSVNLDEESQGIKKLFEVICPIIDILAHDSVLVWDEIETSLHPHIVSTILELFMSELSESQAQLIFSTHDTNLLDLSKFRRDQIWFTELTDFRSTDLYSLAELKNVRKDENISKGYLNGKYGAIPFIQNTPIFPIKEN